jgi:hypothetical protein
MHTVMALQRHLDRLLAAMTMHPLDLDHHKLIAVRLVGHDVRNSSMLQTCYPLSIC